MFTLDYFGCVVEGYLWLVGMAMLIPHTAYMLYLMQHIKKTPTLNPRPMFLFLLGVLLVCIFFTFHMVTDYIPMEVASWN